MDQQQGVISQNQKDSISQKFPYRSFRVIHQNDRIFILHIAALSVFMAFFLIPNFFQEQCVLYFGRFAPTARDWPPAPWMPLLPDSPPLP